MARFLINGTHVDALDPVGWEFVTGGSPHVASFQMDAGEADSLIRTGGECTLTIEDQKILTIKKLSIIGQAPSSAPMYKTVLVADLRWRWSRRHVFGRYNIRRRTGQKTLQAENALFELAQTTDDFKFAPWSLNGDRKFTPKEVMEDVLGKLKAVGDFEHVIKSNVVEQLEVNDLEVNDLGPEAVDVALRHLPGSVLWVDAEGKVVVQSALDGAEGGVVLTSGPETVGGGHASLISYSLTRPNKIVFYFTREQEVRFDSRTEQDGTRAAMVDEREMENVLVVTDPVILSGGQLSARGSVIAFEEAFPYFNQTKEIDGAFDISHDFIQSAFFEDNMFSVHVPWGDDSNQAIWMGRISSIKANYRQLYRITHRWVSRTYKMKEVRASLLDETTGTRGRAQAFTDYARRMSANVLTKDPDRQHLFENVTGYATYLSDAEVAPALVIVVDDQAGIVKLDYKTDSYGTNVEIYPSTLDNLPTKNASSQSPIGLGIRVGRFGAFPKLSANHRAAVVLTVVPAAPNNLSQFYRTEVNPEDVAGLVPGLKIKPAHGPTWEVMVDEGLVTARMAWTDEAAAAIERSFGVGISDPQTPEAKAAADEQAKEDADVLRGLVVNHDDLDAVGRAIAAQIWSKMVDRYVGKKTVRMDPKIEIVGSVDSLRHTVEVDGRVVTEIFLPEQLKDRNPLALLPDGVRRRLRREVAL